MKDQHQLVFAAIFSSTNLFEDVQMYLKCKTECRRSQVPPLASLVKLPCDAKDLYSTPWRAKQIMA